MGTQSAITSVPHIVRWGGGISGPIADFIHAPSRQQWREGKNAYMFPFYGLVCVPDILGCGSSQNLWQSNVAAVSRMRDTGPYAHKNTNTICFSG